MVDYAQARRMMVDCQVRPSDVTDLRIIAAMQDIARERFVPEGRRSIAYLDADVPVSAAGTRALMKAMVFSKLLQAAAIRETDRVLDVGCATGYSAAVLGRLAGSVVALEEDPALARAASDALGGAGNISVVTGPLAAGWAQGGPYDVVLLEGSGEVIPDALTAQLKDGGRLLAIVGSGPLGKATTYRSSAGHVSSQPLFDATAPALPGFARPQAFVF